MLLVIFLCSLLMMGAGIGLYLTHQVSEYSRNVSRADKELADYHAKIEPRLKAFIGDLQKYARTNPDFAPILAKYGVLTNFPPAMPAPAPAK
ncbi:MAG TPA: hypothetical protein VL527_03785 [Dongiaceae bacterium]|jgi:hypothetical protein|nr:hypothetical protein [Dongiaceae bacterium]